jgi:hypothetical protein
VPTDDTIVKISQDSNQSLDFYIAEKESGLIIYTDNESGRLYAVGLKKGKKYEFVLNRPTGYFSKHFVQVLKDGQNIFDVLDGGDKIFFEYQASTDGEDHSLSFELHMFPFDCHTVEYSFNKDITINQGESEDSIIEKLNILGKKFYYNSYSALEANDNTNLYIYQPYFKSRR